MGRRIGFISFRLAGTDGVSLETAKWAEVLEDNGHTCFYMAGELDTPEERSYLLEDMHFQIPEIRKIHTDIYSMTVRPKDITDWMHKTRHVIKEGIYKFLEKFDIEMIIPENALTIPINIPLAMALTEIINETGIPTIAHHHDFFWERQRFLRNCVWDYLHACYPPEHPNIHHVVINSAGQSQLAFRKGIASTLIPNVMNFEEPPPKIDDYTRDVRKQLGIAEDELFILQPTRVVQRKGIEHAIEFVARLNRKATFVISHASGDEGYEYQQRVKEYSELLGIKALFVDNIIGERRKIDDQGRKCYSLDDIYPHADLVTYPSLFEGFGNAFLEAIYHKKPILVNNYSIYAQDIKPKGFKVIEMDNFISHSTIEQTLEVLDNPQLQSEMVEKNYELALRHYSYHILDKKLEAIITGFWGKL
jgi:glycosyltransferase involved in cell wall biosynthesis